jgi:hypothetical protein
VFDSLADQLRDAAICASRAPQWLSFLALLLAFRMIVTALRWAVARELAGGLPENALNAVLIVKSLRMETRARLRAPDLRPLGRRLVWGVFIFAVLSGVASTGFTAWILGAADESSSLLVWALIAIVSIAVTNTEKMLTERRYAQHAPKPEPPAPAEAAERLQSYTLDYPWEARTASPLIYAHSRLERDEIGVRFAELSMSGAVGRTGRVVWIVLVAALFPYVSAPDVEPLEMEGFVGCLYTDFYGFFRVAEENMTLSTVVALLLVAVSPLAVLSTYLQFMREWRFPARTQLDVLRRELGFAGRMMIYQPASYLVTAPLAVLSLWGSAVLATKLDSPVAGLTVLAVAVLSGLAVYRIFMRLLTA